MTVRDPGVDGRLERPQVQVAQGVLADADRVVVAATGGEAVAGEVLGARGEAVGVARVVALEAAHERGGEAAREHRRLAERLGDPAPARLLGDVDHRRERPRDPVDDGLAGRDLADLLGEVGVEGGGDAERDRAHRAVAVDDVAAEEQRDAEAAALDGVALGGVDVADEDALVALVAARRRRRRRGSSRSGRPRSRRRRPPGRCWRPGGSGRPSRPGSSRPGGGRCAPRRAGWHRATAARAWAAWR